MFSAAPIRGLAVVLGLVVALMLPGVGPGQDDTAPPPRKQPSADKDRPGQEPSGRKGKLDRTPRKPQRDADDDGDDDLMPFGPQGRPRGMPGFDPDEIQQIQREFIRMQREMMRQMQQFGGQGGMFVLPGMAPEDTRQSGRLGVHLEQLSAVLIDQLDLPRGQGQVVRDVQPDSPAARAGIKAHDILLEVGGQPVSSDIQSFRKQVAEIKANEAIEVVVLRKGKRETLKGLTLPKARARPQQQPAFPAVPQIGFGAVVPQGGNGVVTSTVRNGDSFTTRHQEGSLVITVKGKVADGKAKVSEIRIQDENDSQRYTSVDKAPEEYQDKIKKLIGMSEKGAAPAEK